VERLDELAQSGVAGFKAFMSASGTLDFRAADDLTLYEGMGRAAELGLPVLVHAENRVITDALSGRAVGALRTTMRDYLDSRPVVAELEATGRAYSSPRRPAARCTWCTSAPGGESPSWRRRAPEG